MWSSNPSVVLESRILVFWVLRILFTYEASGGEVLGGLPLWEGQRSAQASPEQLLLTAQSTLLCLCFCARCLNATTRGSVTWRFGGPVDLGACWWLSLVFSGECFVPQSRLVYLGLYKWMFAVVWKEVLRSAFHSFQVLLFLHCVTLIFMELLWKEV